MSRMKVWGRLLLFLSLSMFLAAGVAAEVVYPGSVVGTGTYFEVTDSEHLNVTVESTESVNLRLCTGPQRVLMEIESASGATSTVISISGLTPSTTYYKYLADDGNEPVEITTDAFGAYAFSQDIATAHIVVIQEEPL